ncbi:MAG: FixH family protein [Rhodospirillales bacterium]|nr:FixH family protein [Rhodospirillales bacterium]MDE2574161.1 FixH family protein [Rhodospirillales bacterium]
MSRLDSMRYSELPSKHSPWRWFPWAVAGTMLVVIAVNGVMVYDAIHTFPGIAMDDVFDRSNAYDKVLAESRHEAKLGWALAVDLRNNRPEVSLNGPDGKPLEGARVAALGQRPLGPTERVRLAFHAFAPGHYRSAEELVAPGQWELQISVTIGKDSYHATRRVIVP